MCVSRVEATPVESNQNEPQPELSWAELSWGEQKAPTGNDKSRKKPAKSMAKSIAKTARQARHDGQTNIVHRQTVRKKEKQW